MEEGDRENFKKENIETTKPTRPSNSFSNRQDQSSKLTSTGCLSYSRHATSKSTAGSQVVDERAKALRGTNPDFIKVPPPLNMTTVCHELSKRRRIRTGLLQDRLGAFWCWDILTDAPATARLVLVAEHEAVEQLCAFRVGCFLQDCAGLSPRDEFGVAGERVLDWWPVCE